MQVDRSIARHLYKHALRGLLARRTVVCVTHQLGIVSAFDRVVLMERGCLRKAGAPHELREAAAWSKCALGEAIAGHQQLIRLHLKARSCPPHS